MWFEVMDWGSQKKFAGNGAYIQDDSGILLKVPHCKSHVDQDDLPKSVP
jgi:hypothetical protein